MNAIELPTGRSVIENNVFVDGGNVQILFQNQDAGVHTIDYNLYFATAGGTHYGNWGASNVTFANWKAACNCDSHSLAVSPVFVNTASTPDLHLQTSSPAKDAGLTLTSQGVTVDFDNVSRPSGSAFDMGAYEFVTAGGGAAPVLLRLIR